jgi:hypothetical protein
LSLVAAADFTATGPASPVGVLAGFPQGGERIRLTPEPGTPLGPVSAQSGATWLRAIPSENRGGEIDLVFDPRGLSSGTYQTTVAVTAGGTPQSVPVSMQLSASNQINQIIADPWRNRVYLLADGAAATIQSRVVVLDAVDGSFVREIAVKRARSMTQSLDGKYLYMMQAPTNAIARIDLQRMLLEPEIPLPGDLGSGNRVFPSLCAGSGKVVYFLDAAVEGKLLAVDLNAGTLIQQIDAPPTAGTAFGRICLSPDGTRLHASLLGVPAGTEGPFGLLLDYEIGADGRLTAVASPERPLLMPAPFARNSPLNFASGGRLVALGDRVWEPGDFLGTGRTFPAYVRGISPDGEVVAGDAGIYHGSATRLVMPLPYSGSAQAMAVSPEGHVFYASSSAFGMIDPTSADPASLFPVHPRDGSNGPAPDRFRWTPVDGAREYRIHFATDAAALQSSQPAAGTLSFVARHHWLDNPLAMARGEVRYWRVDALAPGGLVRGPVRSFSVADFGIEARELVVELVKGSASQPLQPQPVLPASGDLEITAGAVPWLSPPARAGGDFVIDTNLMPSNRESTVLVFENGSLEVSVPLTVVLHSCQADGLIVDPNAPILHALARSTTGANFVARVDAANGQILDSRFVGQGALQICLSADGRQVGIERQLGGFFNTSGGVQVLDSEDYSRQAEWVSHYNGPFSTSALQTAFGPADRMVHAGRLFDWRTGTILARGASGNGAITVISPDGTKAYSSSGAIRSYDMTSPTLAPLALYSDPQAGGESRPAISRDGSRLAWGRAILDPDLQEVVKGTDPIRDMSADGKILVGNEGLYHVPSLRRFGNAPGPLQNIEISDLARTVVRPNQGGVGEELRFIVTPYAALLALDGLSMAPAIPVNSLVAADAITLRWSDLAAASGYRVFFGTDREAVAAAEAGSPLELGLVSSPQWPAALPLEDGMSYYWKVIAEGPYATSSSALWSFRTPDFAFEKQSMALLGPVAGTAVSATNSITLPAGKSWSLSTTTPWIQLPVTGGTGTGSFEVRATPAATGNTRTGSVRVTIGPDVVDIPVSFFSFRYGVRDYAVDPALGVMHLLVAPVLANAGLDRLYLMRVDLRTLAVLEVFDTALEHQGNGSTTARTKMVVHPQDGRLYLYHSTGAKVLGLAAGPYGIVSQFSTTSIPGINPPADMAAGGAGRLAFGLSTGGISINSSSDGQRLHATTGDSTTYSLIHSAGDRLYVMNSSPARPKFFELRADSIAAGTLAAESAGTFGSSLQISADGGTLSYNQGFYDRDLSLLGSIPNAPSGPERIVAINANGSQFLAMDSSGQIRWAARSGTDPELPVFSMHSNPKIQWDSTKGRMFYRLSSSSGFRWLKTLAAGELPLPTIIGSDGWVTSGPADWRETSAGSGVLRTPTLVQPASSDLSPVATLAFKSKLTGTLNFDWRNTTNGSETFTLRINGTTVETRGTTNNFVRRSVIVPTGATVEFTYSKPFNGSTGTSPAGELRNIFMTFSGALILPDDSRLDSDGDGASDLLEKALGSDPEQPSSTPATAIAGEPGAPAFVYERPPGLPYRYEVQISDDLNVWETLEAIPRVETATGKERVSVPIPTDRARAFVRLQVSAAQP